MKPIYKVEEKFSHKVDVFRLDYKGIYQHLGAINLTDMPRSEIMLLVGDAATLTQKNALLRDDIEHMQNWISQDQKGISKKMIIEAVIRQCKAALKATE